MQTLRVDKLNIITSGSGAGFLSDPRFEFVRGASLLELKEPLGYRHADGTEDWIEIGYRFDGASIPRFAWTIVDHPFSDWLVRGACWHDRFCEERTYPHEFVHRTFGNMIRFDAETWMQRNVKARLCYHAVATFGPKWKI